MTDILTRLAALTANNYIRLAPCPFCGMEPAHFMLNCEAHVACCITPGCLMRDLKCSTIAWYQRPREAALIALVQEAAAESKRLRDFIDVIRMKAEWRFQGSDFVAEEDPAYPKVSEAAIAATAYLRDILAIATKALNPQEAGNG